MKHETLDDLIKAVDPASHHGHDAADLDDRARRDRDAILRSHLTGRAGRVRRPLRLAAVAAGVVMITGVVVAQPWSGDAPGPGSAYAATPPLVVSASMGARPAGSRLQALARTVAAQPPEQISGPVLKITTKEWNLVTSVDAEDVHSTIEGSTVTSYVGHGEVVSGEDPNVHSAASWPGTLSPDPAVLRRQLAVNHGEGVDAVFSAITDLYRVAAPQPAVRAAVLQILAGQPQVREEGEVTDRLGRRGVGFSALLTGGGLPTKTTLVFDPSSGDLLSREQMLTKSAGKLNVPIPSVISYVVYSGHVYVASGPR